MKKTKVKILLTAAILLAFGFNNSCVIHDYDTETESAGGRDIGPDTMPEVKGAAKRGVCFNNLSAAQVTSLMGGGNVTWAYNWGETPVNTTGNNPAKIGTEGSLAFMPMTWGSNFSEAKLREYLDSVNDEDKESVKCLLGFNEPNLGANVGGCAMLPDEAAELWPTLEKIVEDYGLLLASPAMQYSGETLSNGKVYSTPESWLNEFIDSYRENNDGKNPRMDYIALHSYMMWPGSVTEGYCDKYAKMYNRKVLLTEFCSWNDDEGIGNNPKIQRQKTSQKIEAMDQDPYVAGYAWFQADGNAVARPWNCLFTDTFKSELSDLGAIYAYLSCYDTEKYFEAGEKIPAASYITSSNYEKNAKDPFAYGQLTFRKNDDEDETEGKSVAPLAIIDFGKNYLSDADKDKFQHYMNYQIKADAEGKYYFSIRYKSTADQQIQIGGVSGVLENSNGAWTTKKAAVSDVNLNAGNNNIRLGHVRGESSTIAWISFEKQN